MRAKTIRLKYVVIIMLTLAAVILATGYCLGQTSGTSVSGGSASNNSSAAAPEQPSNGGGRPRATT